MIALFCLLVSFQLKHYLCDYVIQMSKPDFYNRKFNHIGWAIPLFCHCVSHFYFTLMICIVYLTYTSNTIQDTLIVSTCLASLDLCLHFIMDRIKSSPRFLGKYLDQDTYKYWLANGFDQMFHHLTHYVIIFLLY